MNSDDPNRGGAGERQQRDVEQPLEQRARARRSTAGARRHASAIKRVVDQRG